MRWAIKDGRGFRIPSPHTDRAEAIAHLRNLRAKAPPSVRYRLVRLVTKSERLQRELDEATSLAERLRESLAQRDRWLLDIRGELDRADVKASETTGTGVRKLRLAERVKALAGQVAFAESTLDQMRACLNEAGAVAVVPADQVMVLADEEG